MAKIINDTLISVDKSEIINGTVTIPNEVTKIGPYAFCGCEGLKTITIPDNITEVGDFAFLFSENLETVTLPNNLTTLNSGVFMGCVSLKEINIPNKITKIDSSAFMECESLTNINIPDTIEYIGSFAFYGCTSLEEIIIPKNVSDIGENAFDDSTNIKFIDTYPGSIVDNSIFESISESESVINSQKTKKVLLAGTIEMRDDDSVITYIKVPSMNLEQTTTVHFSENETIIDIDSSTGDDLRIVIHEDDNKDEIILTNSEGKIRRYSLVEVDE